MTFSTPEKIAINCLLVKLMKVDGQTDLAEAAVLYGINKFIGITINEADSSFAMSREEALAIIKCLNDEKKEVVKNLFTQMASSDGHIDDIEKQLILDTFS